MTNKEAIMIIRANALIGCNDEATCKMMADACDMAIKALEQPEIIKCKNCKRHHRDNNGIPYCDKIDYGYGWQDDDFCSRAESYKEGDQNV